MFPVLWGEFAEWIEGELGRPRSMGWESEAVGRRGWLVTRAECTSPLVLSNAIISKYYFSNLSTVGC